MANLRHRSLILLSNQNRRVTATFLDSWARAERKERFWNAQTARRDWRDFSVRPFDSVWLFLLSARSLRKGLWKLINNYCCCIILFLLATSSVLCEADLASEVVLVVLSPLSTFKSNLLLGSRLAKNVEVTGIFLQSSLFALPTCFSFAHSKTKGVYKHMKFHVPLLI